MAVLGWTAGDLAKECGVTRMTVNRFLNGGSNKSAPAMKEVLDRELEKAGCKFTAGRSKEVITCEVIEARKKESE